MIRRLKLLLAGIVMVSTLSAAGGTAHAFDIFGSACQNNSQATVCQDSGKQQSTSNNTLYGPDGIIGKVANIIAIIVGIAAVIVIIIAGIQYMLSTGDSTKVNNAKNTILYAIIGLVVTVLARTIVIFVVSKVA